MIEDILNHCRQSSVYVLEEGNPSAAICLRKVSVHDITNLHRPAPYVFKRCPQTLCPTYTFMLIYIYLFLGLQCQGFNLFYCDLTTAYA